MTKPKMVQVAGGMIFLLFSTLMVACDLPPKPNSTSEIPADFAGSHMPEGWWANQAVIDAGRQIYLGAGKRNVNCSKCHGQSGKPLKSGAPNFRNPQVMKTYSDSHLFWRISEGVPYTTMVSFKNKLSEDEIWKVIAFIGTFGMEGLQYDPQKNAWVPSG